MEVDINYFKVLIILPVKNIVLKSLDKIVKEETLKNRAYMSHDIILILKSPMSNCLPRLLRY
jgi:hypothetical protein